MPSKRFPIVPLLTALAAFVASCVDTAPPAELTPDGHSSVEPVQRASAISPSVPRAPNGGVGGAARLTSLVPSIGTLSPPFSPDVTQYVLSLPPGFTGEVALTPEAERPDASLEVNGRPIAPGGPSPSVPLGAEGVATFRVCLTTPEGITRTYRVIGVGAASTYLKASNTEETDTFGFSVALSGDTLAVGALQEDSAATGVNGDQASNSRPASGAVYVFTRAAGVWSQQSYVKASNTEEGDFFGTSIALWGNNLAVGAQQESSAATGVNGNQANNGEFASGAVYVF